MTHTRTFRCNVPGAPIEGWDIELPANRQSLKFGGLVSTSYIECSDGSGFFFDTSAGSIMFYFDGRVTWGGYPMDEIFSDKRDIRFYGIINAVARFLHLPVLRKKIPA